MLKEKRLIALVTSVAVASGGAAVLTAGAAQAESAPLTYDCTTILGPTQMQVVTDTDLPAAAHTGDSLPVTLTSKVTVPGSIIGLAYGLLGARSVSGTATAAGTVTGPGGTVATSTALTVPSTPLPASGDLVITSTGASPTFAPTDPGSYAIGAGDFSSTLTFYDANGKAVLADQTIPCTAPTEADTTVDTVAVTYASTTAIALSRSSTTYGKAVTATARVTTTGGAAAGSVSFAVAGKTLSAPVRHGVARVTLPTLPVGTSSVTASFTPSDPALYDASSATASLSVAKAPTRTAVSVTGSRPHHSSLVTVHVTSTRTPDGSVTVVLKRAGHEVWARTVTLHDGRATLGLPWVGRAGTYLLQADYLGTSNFETSSRSVTVHVR